jgi:hypothetical protein
MPFLYLHGEENNNGMADRMGCTVMQDLQSQGVYSKKKDDSLISSGARVGCGNARKAFPLMAFKSCSSL